MAVHNQWGSIALQIGIPTLIQSKQMPGLSNCH